MNLRVKNLFHLKETQFTGTVRAKGDRWVDVEITNGQLTFRVSENQAMPENEQRKEVVRKLAHLLLPVLRG